MAAGPPARNRQATSAAGSADGVAFGTGNAPAGDGRLDM